MKRALAALSILTVLSGCVYSEGDRSGVVSKFSRKGMLCKSWEGELFMGGGAVVGNNISYVFNFSVTDPAIVTQVQDALTTEKRVILHYEEYKMGAICSRDTDYVIKSVRVL